MKPLPLTVDCRFYFCCCGRGHQSLCCADAEASTAMAFLQNCCCRWLIVAFAQCCADNDNAATVACWRCYLRHWLIVTFLFPPFARFARAPMLSTTSVAGLLLLLWPLLLLPPLLLPPLLLPLLLLPPLLLPPFAAASICCCLQCCCLCCCHLQCCHIHCCCLHCYHLHYCHLCCCHLCCCHLQCYGFAPACSWFMLLWPLDSSCQHRLLCCAIVAQCSLPLSAFILCCCWYWRHCAKRSSSLWYNNTIDAWSMQYDRCMIDAIRSMEMFVWSTCTWYKVYTYNVVPEVVVPNEYKKCLILFICTSHRLLICREKIMRQYEAGTNEK